LYRTWVPGKKESAPLANIGHKLVMENGRLQHRRRLLFLSLAGWTLFVVAAFWWLWRSGRGDFTGPDPVLLSRDWTPPSLAERMRDWFRLVHFNFQRIYPWILFAPYVACLASAFALERGRLRSSLPVHLAACAAFLLGSYALNSRSTTTMARVVLINSNYATGSDTGKKAQKTVRLEVTAGAALDGLPQQFSESFVRTDSTNRSGTNVITARQHEELGPLTNFLAEFGRSIKPPLHPVVAGPRPLSTLLDLFAYAAIVGLAHSVHYYRCFRERERRALFLESNLAQARLSALQAQLQPHFLFNALNAIAALLRRDPRAAEVTVTSLSELLRLTLSQSGKQEIPLREELHFLERYVEIQLTRFGDALRFEQEVEPAALECLVPTLVLQPLVENAIRHGFEPTGNPGLVRVSAQRQDQRLLLKVTDNGAGFALESNEETQKGIGLSNLRARLEALYGANQKLELTNQPEGGAAVRIELPWHTPAALPSGAGGAQS
jgi:two-component sensor histidine kinase